MNPRVLIALVLAVALALGALTVSAAVRGGRDEGPASVQPSSRFEGALMPPGVRAPEFTLRNQDGESVSMRRLRGRPVVVTFLYTSCRESCPAQAETVKGALDLIGRDLPALAVAVDPPRDTQGRARAFLARHEMLGRMEFLVGSRQELLPVWRGFAIQPQEGGQEHQARFTLVDKRGFQRIGFPGEQATPERLAHDLRLLEEE